MLRGKSRPDMDQDMAVLTEMVQTGLYIQEMARLLYREFMRTLQNLQKEEDRTARLERDLANCLKVLVEAMGDGTDFPRVELETKHKIVVDALQAQRLKEKKIVRNR